MESEDVTRHRKVESGGLGKWVYIKDKRTMIQQGVQQFKVLREILGLSQI